MGYYVQTVGGYFRIPEGNIDDAYRAVCLLNERDDLKSGGAYGGDIDRNTPRPEGLDYHPGRWFSWMDANYPDTCPTLASVFESLGFTVIHREGEGLYLEEYDSKIGQEELFLATIAPYCDRSSSFEWRGECGEMWRHSISDEGRLLVWECEVSFINPTTVEP